mgnify:CR=1 FL=1
MWILLNSLALIFSKHQTALEILDSFTTQFEKNYYQLMSQKLGFKNKIVKEMVDDFLKILQKNSADYTKSFRDLSVNLLNPDSPMIKGEDYQNWFANWRQKIVENSNNNLAKIAK